MSRKTIGVLGGLGPRATADFFQKVIDLTPAARDQDHLRVLIDNNPAIPDRSAAIFGRGESPVPALVATARTLERGGADLIAIPCNTAHFFYAEVAAAVTIPVLHIMREVARDALAMIPTLRRVGLLGTTATARTALYHDAFARRGVEVVLPTPERQEAVTGAIFRIKAGDLSPAVRGGAAEAARELEEAGVEAIVLGCTELPLVLAEAAVPLVDSTLVLARAAVALALGQEREAATGTRR